MNQADVRSFMVGILACFQSFIVAAVVLLGGIFLLAMLIPMPESGLAFELIALSLSFLPASVWMFLRFTGAARRGARSYMGFLTGVVTVMIVAEILAQNGLIPDPPGEPIALVIPEWLISVWANTLFAASAYAGYHVGKGQREAKLNATPPAPAPTPSHGPYGAPGPGA